MALIRLLCVAAGATAGFLYAAIAAERRLADELPARWEGQDIRVAGIVRGLPAVNHSDRSVRFAFDVERVGTPAAIVPSRLSLAWYTTWRGTPLKDDEPLPELHAGERWQLTVRLRRPHGNANPHGFDLEAWMLENGLRATGYVRRDEGNRRLAAHSGRFIDRVDALRESIRERILRALDGRPYAGVLVALAVGDQRSVPQDQWLLYNRTGVSHLLSISGLHVTLFATVFGGAVYWCWRRSHRLTTRLPARKAAALLGALAAFGYVLLAGFEVPAQRTLYMLSVAALGLWIGRPGTAWTVLAWALFAVLLVDPWAVLAAGFWLSFGAVALLMYVGAGRLAANGGGHWLAAAGRAQWAITVGLIPLMLSLFQQVSLVAPLANALAIPVVGMVVVPLALVWLVLPWDGILLGAHQLFALAVIALEWLNTLPAAVWSQHAPPAWGVAAGVVGVLLLLAPRGLHVRLPGWPGCCRCSPCCRRGRNRARCGWRCSTWGRGWRWWRARASTRCSTTPVRATTTWPMRATASSRRTCARGASAHSTRWSSRTRTPITAAARCRCCRRCRWAGSRRRCPTITRSSSRAVARARRTRRATRDSTGTGMACASTCCIRAGTATRIRESGPTIAAAW
ncbi:MAG: ComEC family competence protein [Betaproteobacteria bacterium]|nr:ComEC family competence protein [Betaproteobacteria bacterium]